jgi:CRP-like cAMP-binding protein
MKGMREKLASYLLEQSEINSNMTFDLPINREALADYLNVSRPSMSRELGRMRDEGVIDFYRSSFIIRDPEAVRAML